MLYTIKVYRTLAGKVPFDDWMDKLSDKKALVAIEVRLDRLTLGNFGQCKSVGDGVHELKIDLGPGYRVYLSKVGGTIVLLLCAGDKGSQQKDIAKAKKYLEDYKIREGKND